MKKLIFRLSVCVTRCSVIFLFVFPQWKLPFMKSSDPPFVNHPLSESAATNFDPDTFSPIFFSLIPLERILKASVWIEFRNICDLHRPCFFSLKAIVKTSVKIRILKSFLFVEGRWWRVGEYRPIGYWRKSWSSFWRNVERNSGWSSSRMPGLSQESCSICVRRMRKSVVL